VGLRLAAGRLISSPLFTLFSVISLAAGVAVTTAVYSVVDALMFTDPGIAEPDRAAFVVTPVNGRVQQGSLSDLDFDDLKRTQTSFSSLSAGVAISPSVASTTSAETLSAEAVEGSYFATLGVSAELGRLIQPSDDAAAGRVAVISDEFWRSRFASDRGVIGRSLRINGQPFEIIGVADARYRGAFNMLLMSTRLWIPLSSETSIGTRRPSPLPPRDQRRLLAFGRLAPDRTIERASAELATIATRLDRDFPAGGTGAGPAAANTRRWSARSVAALTDQDNSLRRFGRTIVALVGLVLLVACTNLANLVLARGAARQGELAVRMAMGASRGRLIWEQCMESLLLAAAGAIASFVAFQAVAAFMTTDYVMGVPFGGAVTISIRPALNAQAVSVALISLLLALAVFGLEPAIQLARTVDIRTALATGASRVRPRLKRQRMVIRWQVAIAAGFFIVATMFIRSTIAQSRHDPGIDMDRVAVAVLNFDNGGWDEARVRHTIDRVFEEARRQQAIETIAASTGLPFGVPALQIGLTTDTTGDAAKRLAYTGVAATPSLFSTLGIEIVRGRGFTDADGPGGAPAIILSELAAQLFFGSSDAIGRSVMVYRPPAAPSSATIVGVARDTDTRWIYSDRRGLAYLPLTQHFAPSITLTARASGDGELAIPALRESIRRADPDLAIGAIGSGDAILAGPFVVVRSMGRGALYLGALTLALSMVGLFGVQSHVVAHRTREIGVRMSVGATASQIKMMVLKDGYRPVFEGLGLGLWGGIAGRIVLRAYMELNDVVIVDPWMLVLTPIPLIAAAFWACYLPASKAARVDPTVALRYE
jgi:predicted permease